MLLLPRGTQPSTELRIRRKALAVAMDMLKVGVVYRRLVGIKCSRAVDVLEVSGYRSRQSEVTGYRRRHLVRKGRFVLEEETGAR